MKDINLFEMASFIFGILSLVSITTVIGPIILGSFAVIFGILGKREKAKLQGKSMYGVIMGASGIGLGLAVIVLTIYLILTDPEYKKALNEAYKEQYGITFDEYVDELKDYYRNGGDFDDTPVHDNTASKNSASEDKAEQDGNTAEVKQ